MHPFLLIILLWCSYWFICLFARFIIVQEWKLILRQCLGCPYYVKHHDAHLGGQNVIYSTHFLASGVTDVMSPCDSNWSLHLRRFPHGKFIPSIDELHTRLLKVLTKETFFFYFLSVYLNESNIIRLYIWYVHQNSD